MKSSHNLPGSRVSRALRDVVIGRQHIPGIPLDIAKRLEGLPNPLLDDKLLADIGAGLVHGYDTDPSLLNTWPGDGMGSFVDWLVLQRGHPVTPAAFGLDPKTAGGLRARELADLAGLARAAVHKLSVEDLAYFNGRDGQKVPASAIPPISYEGSVETWLAMRPYEDLMPIAELLTLPVMEMAVSFSKLSRTRADMAELAAVLVKATRDELPLDTVLPPLLPGSPRLRDSPSGCGEWLAGRVRPLIPVRCPAAAAPPELTSGSHPR